MPEAPITLKEVRERTIDPNTGKSFTGEAVARLLNVSTNTYFRWEWGQTIPTGTNLVALEQVLPGSTLTFVKVSPATTERAS